MANPRKSVISKQLDSKVYKKKRLLKSHITLDNLIKKVLIMDLKENTILITGGSTGIGLALAKRFLDRDNTVIICGRRKDKLKKAKELCPKLHIKRCDVADESQRIALYHWAVKEFPGLNVLINNAGIQQRINLKDQKSDWAYCKQEIAINLEAPIHLSKLFITHLMKQKKPVIMNVSSGLAFMPPAWVPVYGATKAGLHSFTFGMRVQLQDVGIEVIEIIPPAVDTDLGGVGLHTFGVPVDDFADEVFKGLENEDTEIGFGKEHLASTRLQREELERNALKIWEQRKEG